MTDKEAIDILQNCVADYVIEDYCDNMFCPMEKECEDRACLFKEAIDVVVNRIKDLEKIEAEHQKTNGKLRVEVESLEKSLGVHDEIIARLEERLTENDKIVLDIVKRLDNDIKNITETKADGYTDDYRRCRLKAYKTKTREIKEYIEEKYFGKKVSEE